MQGSNLRVAYEYMTAFFSTCHLYGLVYKITVDQ